MANILQIGIKMLILPHVTTLPMENRIRYTKIKRLLAFIFDFAFILFLASAADMLFGLIYPLDSKGYQTFMIYPLLIIIVPYLFFGEILFRNTLGKVVFGLEIIDFEQPDRPSLQSLVKRGLLKIIFPVEGLILLFSRSKRRLGDLWARTIVVNKNSNRIKPYARIVLGVVAMVVSYSSFAISLGLAAKRK
jgi:uncharacterized RDD family membrane protein YckC